jgi:hypothetical protein
MFKDLLNKLHIFRLKAATLLYLFLGGKDIQEAMGYSMALVQWVEENMPQHEIQAMMEGYVEKYNLYLELDWPKDQTGKE